MTRNELIESLFNFKTTDETILLLKNWEKLFIEYNSHTNLMSKNDIPILFEKHVLDSLSITLFENFKNANSILDVGCGGGFPSVILSIFFPEKKIYGVDSRIKKINFLNIIKNELKLTSLEPICARIEDISPINVDIITNRAVGKIEDIWNYSCRHLKKAGFFISYKSKTAEDETKICLEKFKNLNFVEYISYKLPLDIKYTRKLVILQKI